MEPPTSSARLYLCAGCRAQVVICSFCDRGNRYCRTECSQKARLNNQRCANQRYQKTMPGKLNHAKRQSEYRERQKRKNQKVTHHGCGQIASHDVLPTPANECKVPVDGDLGRVTHCCSFCGLKVSQAVRTDFVHQLAGHSGPLGIFYPQGP